MNASGLADSIADGIKQVGQRVVLRRPTLGPGNRPVYQSVTCWATVRGYQPQELVGTIMQGDRQITLSNREITARQWPGPPRVNDLVLIGDRTAIVRAVDSPNIGDVTLKHTLQVRGG